MLSVEMVHGERRLSASLTDIGWQVNRREPMSSTDMDSEAFAYLLRDWYYKGCDRFVIHLEDVILVLPVAPEWHHDGKRLLVAFDCLTGKCYNTWLADAELAALLFLAIGGDDVDGTEAYELLEGPLADWPTECRPVP